MNNLNNFLPPNSFHKSLDLIAIILIVGVVLPILQPKFGFGRNVEVVFINFSLLSKEGVKFLFKLGAIYPLIAGMVILIINHPQNQLNLLTKSIVIMVISVLPFLFIFSEGNFITDLGSNQNISSLIQSSVLGILGMLILLSTGLALKSGRISFIVKILGTVSACAYLISLLIPVNNKLMIETFFDLLTTERDSPGGIANIIGLVGLISTGLLITTSIYALMIWNLKYLNNNTGALIVKLWISSQVTILSGAIYSLIVSIAIINHAAEIGIALLVIIKVILLVYGLIILASVAVANFLTIIPENTVIPNYYIPQNFQTTSHIDNSDAIENKLIKLKNLFEKNIITKEEYEIKKREYIEKL